MINILSSVVAIEYMHYSFKKKYSGARRWFLLVLGCVAYFITVTALNQIIKFEGVLGFFYGLIVVIYAFFALQGNCQDFLLAGLIWVLIALIGTYGIFGVMGLLTGKSLEEMLWMGEGQLIYASIIALIVKFCMGKMVSVFLQKREGFQKKENWIVVGAFLFMGLLAIGMFWLETGELKSIIGDTIC